MSYALAAQNRNETPIAGSNCSQDAASHDHSQEVFVTSIIYTVVAPLLLVLGTFGNFMVYVVIGHVCPGTTTSVHFRNLAVFDTLSAYIITVLPLTHYAFGYHILSTSRVSCAGLIFLRYITGDVAIWLELAITVDRLLAVWRPLQVRSYCTPTTALRVMLTLLLLGLLKNGHILFVRGLVAEQADPCKPRLDVEPLYDCTTLKDNAAMYFFEKKVRPLIALVTVSVIPAFGVVLCNACITALICRSSKQWSLEMRSEKQSTPAEKQKSAMEKKWAKGERNSLILTLVNSTAFFIFVFPSFILCLLRHELPLPFVVSDSVREDMLLACTDALIIGNHSLNFYLCCAASRSFRHKVRQYLVTLCTRLGLLKNEPKQTHHHHHQYQHQHTHDYQSVVTDTTVGQTTDSL